MRIDRAVRTGATLLALAGSALAQTPTVRTVLDNGPSATRYDMVILADGYQAAEEGRFNQDVLTFLTGLCQKEPFSTFSLYFNVQWSEPRLNLSGEFFSSENITSDDHLVPGE